MKILFFFLLSFSSILGAKELQLQKAHYSFTFDQLDLPNNEKMGLLGKNILLDYDNNTYFGLGIYSAVTGKRGGFFTGGFEAGYKYKLTENIDIDTGVFIGGGGGGSAPQGGGLMLRPHLGLNYDLDDYSLSLSVSKVKFPNGNIESDQLSLGFEIPFESIYKTSNTKASTKEIDDFIKFTGRSIGWSDHYFMMTYQRYLLPTNLKNLEGKSSLPHMQLIGFEYGKQLSRNSFYFLETAGAGGGDADGYAQVLGGIGFIKPFSNNMGMVLKGSLGAAGGGRVDTAGGLVHKESIGVYYTSNSRLSLLAEAGYIGSFSGAFHAPVVKIGLSYNMKTLSIGKKLRSLSGDTLFDNQKWNIRLSNQRYLSSKSLRKNQIDDTPVDLIGFKVDRFVSDGSYITGQALGAYKGKAGGYAVGLLGLGKKIELTEDLMVFAEATVGVAGGGSIATGSGIILQPSVGLEYKISDSLSVQSSIGKIEAINGDLDASVVDVGLNFQFSTIE